MSILDIRRALEKRVSALGPSLPTAFDNTQYAPTLGVAWQRVSLLSAPTSNPTLDEQLRYETGLLQVSLFYPVGKGSRDAETRAEALRAWFPAGLELFENAVKVRIRGTPAMAALMYEPDWLILPVSIRYTSLQR